MELLKLNANCHIFAVKACRPYREAECLSRGQAKGLVLAAVPDIEAAGREEGLQRTCSEVLLTRHCCVTGAESQAPERPPE